MANNPFQPVSIEDAQKAVEIETKTASQPEPEAKEEIADTDIQGQMEAILKEHNNLESEIPLSSAYWHLKNVLRSKG